jgi:hypothetical protein
MKVIKLIDVNFKALENFSADLNGYNVLLLGDNEVGKTSVIQFIKTCIGDKTCIPPGLNGSGEMVMEIDGKPVTFKLEVENGVPYINVTGDGISIKNKKSDLAELVGAYEFDPDHFVKMSETKAGRKEQVQEFKDTFIPEDIRKDLAKHENNAQNYYDQRTEVNKEVAKLEGSIKTNPMYNHIHELDKFKPVDVSAVIAERDKAQKNNSNILTVKAELIVCDKAIENAKKEIAELEAKIAAHNAVIDMNIEKINKCNEWLKTHTEISTEQYDQQIAQAGEINKKAGDAENLKKQLSEIENLKNQSGELTVMVDSSRQLIADTIKQLDSIVPGLGFDEDQLVYNGIPVHPNTMSTSQRAQLAVILKRAENPNLPILLECSESWGKKKFDWLQELSQKEGFQFIAERVESGKEKLEIKIINEGKAETV